MINTILLAAVQSTVPPTPAWTPTVGLVMVICNLLAIVIGYYAIQNAGVGPDLPVGKPAIFKRFGIAELLATTSFGHILGAGAILGLTNAGVI
ncbi:MAG TPA: photosystem I reaction center subunit PsaK [Cyanobacteria bacterium UBA11162]|nr:photosystem I reaction center subunit PsaK [Cyanobacteria bacterium UBA11162]